MRKALFIYILVFVLCLVSSNLTAQTVGYTYKALAAEGCNMKYSVAKQDTAYYIIATVRSDRMTFLSEPTMKMRTFNDEVITLSGVVIGNGSQSAGIVSGNIVIPVTEISSTAQFKVTPEQFESIKSGIAKVRLDMTPMNHERTFKKDKIGKKLYQFYLKAKVAGRVNLILFHGMGLSQSLISVIGHLIMKRWGRGFPSMQMMFLSTVSL